MRNRRGLAEAAGRWSATNRWTAVLLWLLFVVVATVLGGAVEPRTPTAAELTNGEAQRAERILEQAGLTLPAHEVVLVQDSGGTVDSARFQAAVNDAVAAVNGTGKAVHVVSPLDPAGSAGSAGQSGPTAVSADRHSALVQRGPSHSTGPPGRPAESSARCNASRPARNSTLRRSGKSAANRCSTGCPPRPFNSSAWTTAKPIPALRSSCQPCSATTFCCKYTPIPLSSATAPVPHRDRDPEQPGYSRPRVPSSAKMSTRQYRSAFDETTASTARRSDSLPAV